MVVVGKWILFYDWNCDGDYCQVEITFNSNGTLSSPPAHGKWVQVEGMISWQYDNMTTTYSGNIVGNAMVGLMSTFTGWNGCWYATKTVVAKKMVAERKPMLNVIGNKAQ